MCISWYEKINAHNKNGINDKFIRYEVTNKVYSNNARNCI